MKLGTFLLTLFIVTPAFAQTTTIDCTLPLAAVADSQTLCEEYRLELREAQADWSEAACASDVLRIGFYELSELYARRAAREVVQDQVRDAVDAYRASYPSTVTPQVCGDGELEAEWEECDDGNTESGDGCEANCELP